MYQYFQRHFGFRNLIFDVLGYEIVFKGMLENAEKGFTTTGKPVNSTIYEIILRKIGGVGH